LVVNSLNKVYVINMRWKVAARQWNLGVVIRRMEREMNALPTTRCLQASLTSERCHGMAVFVFLSEDSDGAEKYESSEVPAELRRGEGHWR
jgi:hypothetical protein